MKKKLVIAIIIFSFFLILIIHSRIDNRKIMEGIKESNLNYISYMYFAGEVYMKKEDPNSHGIKTIFIQTQFDTIYLRTIFDTSRFYDKVEPGDSVFKTMGNKDFVRKKPSGIIDTFKFGFNR
jgi:lipopolysaccharide export LptBFGC system permease protein LptF